MENTPIQNYIQYLKNCYQSDQRENNIWDIFHAKVEQALFFTGEEELLNATIPKQYLPPENAEAILKTLELYRKEKALYYFSFFIVGKMGNNTEETNQKKIAAPLLYYPAEIFEEENTFYFKLDFSKQFVNYPLISALDNIDNESYENTLFDALPEREITFLEYENLIKALKPYLTEVDFKETYRYPEKLADAKELKKLQRKNTLTFMPASCLAILSQSKQTKGVLNELNQMSLQKSFSMPLQKLFSEDDFQKALKINLTTKEISVPANLSLAQKNSILIAQKENLSVLIGPPGTGKSFTIAALATEIMNQGKSVLIVSKTDTAVDVIAHKIEEQLGLKGCIVRAGRKEYLSNLKKYLKDILSGIGIPDAVVFLDNIQKIKELEEGLKNLRTEKKLIEKKSKEIVKQLFKDSKYLQNTKIPKFFLKKWVFNWKKNSIQKKQEKQGGIWKIIEKFKKIEEEENQILQRLIFLKYHNKIRQSLNKNRREFNLFSKAISSRRDSRQEDIFKQIDFRVIFKTFPIWLTNLSDIYDVLPLKKEIFDIALIDEASQCDIASCLAIFQRAKNVLVVGDSKQLRHISFLSRAKQSKFSTDFQVKNFIDYREESILDLVQEKLTTQSQNNFLNEHFRSYPEIIQFSNECFYHNSLKLMKAPIPSKNLPLELVKINGKRDDAGYNELEAKFIIKKILDLQGEKHNFRNIGILSPFRSQVDYISNIIQEKLPLELIKRYSIEVGTAHSFQGNEKDLMFISFVVDNESKGGSFNHLNKNDLFNVSITRASEKQYILLSVTPEKINKNSLLYNYISYIENLNKKYLKSTINKTIESKENTLKQIQKKLNNGEYLCQIDYKIAGTSVDILLEKSAKKLAIDLIGKESNSSQEEISFEKIQLLKRSDIQLTYISYIDWFFAQDSCLKMIEENFA